jgi:hypothetical protein
MVKTDDNGYQNVVSEGGGNKLWKFYALILTKTKFKKSKGESVCNSVPGL